MAYKLDEKGNIVSDDAYKGIVATAGNFGTVKNASGQVLTGLDPSGELMFGSAAPISRYTSPGSVPSPLTPAGGPRAEAGSAFSAGGALGERAPYTQAEEDKVRKDAADRVRSQVDAIIQSSLLVRNAAIKSGIGNLGRARAGASATGMLGSPIGDSQESEVEAINNEKLAVIEAKKNADISAILNGANEKAQTAIEARKIAAATNEKSYLDYLSGLATNANNQIITLAKAGSSYDDLAKKDSVGLQNLLDQAGISAEGAKAIMIANAPAGTYINSDKPQISADGKTATFFKQSRGPDGKPIITAENIALPVSTGTDPKNIDIVSRDDGIYILNKADGTFKKVGEASAAMVNAQNKGVGGNKPFDESGMEFGTPEYTLAAIDDSSKYGDKRLLADERKNITASKRALGSLELYNQVLNGKLSSTLSKENFGEGTGVIQGRIRTLAGMWGADPNAAAINAVIQGIIPTVARGIFQEVGVLTDQDIANYKKVVPDINKPENANKLIELVLLKTLERSYADTLLTAAQNQTNVSNFKSEYKSVVDRINKLTQSVEGGTTQMTGPDGKTKWDVPNDQVETFKQHGYNKSI